MVQDYNPDKEKHIDHSWIVQPATRKPDKGIEIDGKFLPFGREGTLRLKDGAVADAVRQKYDRQMVVTRTRRPDAHDRGHNYFFGSWPEMPWKRRPPDPEEEEEIEDPGGHAREEIEEVKEYEQ